MSPKRRLFNIDVSILSLVKRGANKKTIIWKSEDSPTEPIFERTIEIKKLDDDQHIVYGIVYAPDEVDTDGDTATAEEIRKAAERFMKAGRTTSVDKNHDYETDEGFVAESWILKSGDPTFPDEKVGAWATGIKIENDKTWQEIKKGDINGISLAGRSEYEDLSKNIEPNIWDRIKEKLGLTKGLDLNRKAANMLVDAFSQAVYEAYDGQKDDPKGYLLASIDEIRNYATNHLEKAGRVISGKNVKKIQDAITALQNLINNATKQEDSEMNKEELLKSINEDEEVQNAFTEFVKNAITEETKPLTEKIAELEKEKAALIERLEKVEKAAPDSQQQQQQDPLEKENPFQFIPAQEQ